MFLTDFYFCMIQEFLHQITVLICANACGVFCFIFNKRDFFTPHKRKISFFFTTKQTQTYSEISTYNVEKILMKRFFFQQWAISELSARGTHQPEDRNKSYTGK